MGRTAKDNDISTVPLDAVDRWIAALGAIPPAARVYNVTPRRAELEFGITSAIADSALRPRIAQLFRQR